MIRDQSIMLFELPIILSNNYQLLMAKLPYNLEFDMHDFCTVST